MYCSQCGKDFEDQYRFCPECGNILIIDEKTSFSNNKKAKSPKNRCKKNPSIFLAFAIVLLISIIVCYIKIDFNKTTDFDPSYNEDVSLDISYEHDIAATLPGEGQYDTLLAFGDGYFLVSRWFENYQEAYTEYGIINEDAVWLIPLSKNNSIARAVDGFSPYAESYYDLKFDYVNDGMFIVRRQCCIFPESIDFYNYAESYIANGGCYVINAETGGAYSAGAFVTKYHDGYCFYLANRFGKIIRMDKNGNTIELTNEGKIPWGEPSNGLIYINKKFYDIKTAEVKIDLSKYDIVSEGTKKFDNDKQFSFTFRNPAGTYYSVTIDMDGNFVDEPQKLG